MILEWVVCWLILSSWWLASRQREKFFQGTDRCWAVFTVAFPDGPRRKKDEKEEREKEEAAEFEMQLGNFGGETWWNYSPEN